MGTAEEQENAFRRIWQTFRAVHGVTDGRHDTAAWRDHEGVYALCIVRVPGAVLQPDLANLRAALAAYPFVRCHPDGFLHISLQELGFLCDAPSRDDEISSTRLDEFISMASDPIGDQRAFDVSLGGVNSFLDAAFLDIHDGGQCAPIHSRLFELAAIPRAPDYPFVPHTTVAHYTREAPSLHLAASLAPWRNVAFGTFRVEQIEVVTMRLDEPYPPLETYATLPLGQ